MPALFAAAGCAFATWTIPTPGSSAWPNAVMRPGPPVATGSTSLPVRASVEAAGLVILAAAKACGEGLAGALLAVVVGLAVAAFDVLDVLAVLAGCVAAGLAPVVFEPVASEPPPQPARRAIGSAIRGRAWRLMGGQPTFSHKPHRKAVLDLGVSAPARGYSAGVSRAAWVLFAVVAVLLAGCGGSARPRSASTAPVAEGRRLFLAQRCGDCHALATVGARGGSGPDFDTSERLTRAQLRAALLEGANGMPSYAGRLTPAQLDAVSAFLFAATHAR